MTSPPEFEMDRRHDARDLGRDEDALIGAQRADRGQFGGHCSIFAASADTVVGFGAKAAVMKPLTITGLMTNWK